MENGDITDFTFETMKWLEELGVPQEKIATFLNGALKPRQPLNPQELVEGWKQMYVGESMIVSNMLLRLIEEHKISGFEIIPLEDGENSIITFPDLELEL